MAVPFRDITVQAASDSYIFTSPSSRNSPALVIDRPTGDIRLSDASLLAGKRVSRVTSIAGILGMIRLRLDRYIVVITKSQPVGRLRGQQIFRVVSTELLPLRERQVHDADEDRFLAMLRGFIKSGPMYFSYGIDITNSFQRQAAHDPSTPLWQRADDRFFWNRFLQSDLIDFRTRGARGFPAPQAGIDPYILPVIFGMLEIHQTTIAGTPTAVAGTSVSGDGVPITLALITRRSRHRAGTRYFTRGLDDQGHAANYNETEQILVLNESDSWASRRSDDIPFNTARAKEMQILSYVQTRGSVPAFWAEVNALKYTPKIQIRAVESALPAARAHFDEQIRLYGDNYLVNLVNQKGRETAVKEAYERVVQRLVSSPREHTQADARTDEKFHLIESQKQQQQSQNPYDRLHYVYFDFHAETKGLQMHRAQLLIDRMHDALIAQGYFRASDPPGSRVDGRLEVRATQTSVVRTNCMDCLDRTNVVQSMLARWTLDRMFADTGILKPGQRFADVDPAFELLFRNMWADNADVVSCAYSGTGAMKTDLTRTGQRTKAGALQDGKVAVVRYIRNNFLDGPRQDAFDLFLGVYRPGDSGLAGLGQVFSDRRPALVQSIPYIAAFGVFFVLLALFTPRADGAAGWPLRLFGIFWAVVAGWCLQFVFRNGMLYVNWPKLNPRPWATEGYHETISKVRKDKILGPLVARHERGLSTARYINAEEGKKRIE